MNIMAMKLFLSGIDGIIYDTLAKMYNLIFEIAQADVFSDDAISDFTIRIYTILGIFMLFKISFSFIKYIINPDSFIDKKTGFQKVIVNIILVFVMLISFPWVFSLLKDAQVALLEDNVLGNFIIGSSPSDNTTNTDYLDRQIKWSNSCDGYIVAASDGDYLSLSIFRPFFQYNSHFSDEDKRKGGVLCDNTTSYDQVVAETKTVSSFITYDKVLGPESGLDGALQVVAGIAAFTPISGVADIIAAAAVDYQVKYLYIISSIVGIMVCGLLISFGFDIAVRSIKLAFLQIIAPIPIISYIEPDSSKQTMFKSWISEVGKTWISLFVRLGALYLAIYVLQLLNMSDDKSDNSIWIKMFFIIGALMFAKKLPSLLQTLIPGLKLDGEFTLNPLKKIHKEALGGTIIAGAGAAIGTAGLSSFGGAAANLYAGKKAGLKGKDLFASGGKGLATGAFHGAIKGYNAGKGGDFNFGKSTLAGITASSDSRKLGDFLGKQGMNGPFKSARYKIGNEVNKAAGVTGSAGFSEKLKNTKKENEIRLKNLVAAQDQANEMLNNSLNNLDENIQGSALSAIESHVVVEDGVHKVEVIKKEYIKFVEDEVGKEKLDSLKMEVEDNLKKDANFLLKSKVEQDIEIESNVKNLIPERFKIINQKQFDNLRNLAEISNDKTNKITKLEIENSKIDNNQGK